MEESERNGLEMNKVVIGMDRSGSFRVYLAITTDLAEEGRRSTIHQ